MGGYLIILLPFFLAGHLIYFEGSLYFFAPLLLVFLFLKRNKSIIPLIIIFTLLGFLNALLCYKNYNNKYEMLKNKNSFEGYVKYVEDKYIEIVNFNEGYNIRLYPKENINIKPGSYVYASGEFNENPYIIRRYSYMKGLNGSVKALDISNRGRYSYLFFPYRLRDRILKGILSVDEKGGSLIGGLVLGYTEKIEDDIRESFNDLGLSHILAVSGFNLGIIFYCVNKALLRAPAKIRYLTNISLCFLYSVMSGFEPSIMRAFIMVLMYNISRLLKRNYDILNILGFTAIVMLIKNAYFLYNLGFIFSFLATFGLIVFNPIIEVKFKIKYKEEISSSISSFIMTFPVVLYTKGYFSILIVPVNLLIGIFVFFGTILGFLSSVLFLITKSTLFFYPVNFLGIIIIYTAEFFEKINLNLYIGEPPIIFIILYYLYIFYISGFIFKNIKGKKAIKVLVPFVLLAFLFVKSPLLKIHFINVGQGDCILIEAPYNKRILLDTGGCREDFCYAKTRVVPYINRRGCNRLDMLILTHDHNDHAGGYEYLKENISFNNEFTPLENELLKGDEINIGKLKISVLAPDDSEGLGENNERCLILSLSYKNFSILLTSDSEAEKFELINYDFDVVQIPHHGSYSSYNAPFIERVNPKAVVISVGKNNYGHPSMKVLSHLLERGIPVYRTDEGRNVVITTNGSKFRIKYK